MRRWISARSEKISRMGSVPSLASVEDLAQPGATHVRVVRIRQDIRASTVPAPLADELRAAGRFTLSMGLRRSRA